MKLFLFVVFYHLVQINGFQLNIFGVPLQTCSTSPVTGFYRDGNCTTSKSDVGSHVICARMTWEFLNFSRSVGNDLTTPSLEFQFPGLVEGNFWCVCAARWKEAFVAGKAPPVNLVATHQNALRVVSLDMLTSKKICGVQNSYDTCSE